MLYLSYWLKHPIILDFYPIIRRFSEHVNSEGPFAYFNIIRFSTLAQEQIG